MEYLTVGTDQITKELFVPVKDGGKALFKPDGGLWLTEYNTDSYNEWLDFLIDNPTVFFYKNRSLNIWRQPCSLVILNKNSKIYRLFDDGSYDFLRYNYPLDTSRFSYEKLAKEYDGIFVDVLKLIRNCDRKQADRIIREFSVSSLLLFNLDCINYYQSGYVLIKPFDFDYYVYEDTGYEIVTDKVKKRIK